MRNAKTLKVNCKLDICSLLTRITSKVGKRTVNTDNFFLAMSARLSPQSSE